MLAMLIDTIDLYYFLPLSAALTLDEGHKVGASGEPNLFGSVSPTCLIDHNKISCDGYAVQTKYPDASVEWE